MTATQFNGSPLSRILSGRRSSEEVVKGRRKFLVCDINIPKRSACKDVKLSSPGYKRNSLSPFVSTNGRNRKSPFAVVYNQLGSSSSSGYGVESKNMLFDSSADGQVESSRVTIKQQAVSSDAKSELILLSLPAIAGQALEPLTQLMETAYIGRLGPVELASAGVSITIFNNISKLFNMPLLSVATSFVAEDIAKNEINPPLEKGVQESSPNSNKPTNVVAERKQLSSVSTALLLAVGIGIFEAIAMSLGRGIFLNLMGITLDSPMRIPAERFLLLRAFGAPAFVMSLALQGVLRGFKDTKTPVYCFALGNLSAIPLFPMLMYSFKLGVNGAAVSTVISRYIVTFLMMWHLSKRAILLPPKLGDLQFSLYMKSGGFLIGRTLAVLITITLATSMSARQGPITMAAHQICMQVWLAVSLLADALAASAQALIASNLSKGDYKNVREVANYVLKLALLTGISLAAILGLSYGSIATLFTKNAQVVQLVRTGILFIILNQPLNALAFVFDGLHYGVSDFAFAASSMIVAGAISCSFLLYGPSVFGFPGIWSGLTLFMGLRTLAGFIRLLSKSGPWWFMHKELRSVQTAS